MPQIPQNDWLTGRIARLDFWKQWLGPDCPSPAERFQRLQSDRPLPAWLIAGLPEKKPRLRVLDVNAGPLSTLGTTAQGQTVELIPIDELAQDFDRLLQQYALIPPVRTRFCAAEDILATFGTDSFDLIFSCNGMDFTRDPLAVYRQMLDCLAPGGRIVTLHETCTRARQPLEEPYRHFHVFSAGRIVIQNRSYRRDLQDALPRARVTARQEGACLKVEIQHASSTGRARLPQPRPTGNGLPELISVHIPKTAGTSFRLFLERLYGPQFRPMYSEEETDPDLAAVFEFSPETRCLHGHIQATAFARQFPNALRITWLREPVQRIVSSYHQYLRHPESECRCSVSQRMRREGWSLLEFAGTPEIRNQQTWYLDALPWDQFLFIGITERYEESLRLLCHLLGVAPPQSIAAVNTNPAKDVAQRYVLTDGQRKQMEFLYAEDLEFYRYATSRLDRQLRQAFGGSPVKRAVR